MKDEGAAEVKATLTANFSGVVAKPVSDLWSNTSTINAVVTDSSASTVKVLYRKSGESTWTEVTATQSAGSSYSAAVAPTWVESTNDASLTIYTPQGGIFANRTYEYKLSVDGVDSGV